MEFETSMTQQNEIPPETLWAPLLSFLWFCPGSDARADVQEVQAPGQARRCLAECVNLQGLPPGCSSTTAWINLQGDEHTSALLCPFPTAHLPKSTELFILFLPTEETSMRRGLL